MSMAAAMPIARPRILIVEKLLLRQRLRKATRVRFLNMDWCFCYFAPRNTPKRIRVLGQWLIKKKPDEFVRFRYTRVYVFFMRRLSALFVPPEVELDA